jgi:hypothetical protein
MAITQISKIQIRRGLSQDLPNLASGELGWSNDTMELWIGNGTASEGAPVPGGKTLIYPQGSGANLTAIQDALTQIQNQLTGQLPKTVNISLPSTSSGQITSITSNNAIIKYTLNQGSVQRSGAIDLSRYATSSTVSYDEEYNQTAVTDIVFSANGNTTQANLYYTTTTATTMLYQVYYIK